MIDTASEDLLSLDQARKTLPGRSGRPVDLSTVIRWIMKGSRRPGAGANDQRVKLEAVRLGGKWMTSRQALQRFAERLTPAENGAGGDQAGELPRTEARRQRSSERAGEALSESGI